MRAPAGGERVRAAPERVASAELDQVIKPVTRPALRHAQQTPCLEQVVEGESGRDIVGEAAGAQRLLSGLDFTLFDQRFDEEGQRGCSCELDTATDEQLE